MINFKNSKKIGFFCVLPLVLFVLVYMVYPILYNVKISFYDWNGIDPDMTFIGIKNFTDIFKDKVFRVVLKNFLLFALFTVTIQAVLGFLLADLRNIDLLYVLLKLFRHIIQPIRKNSQFIIRPDIHTGLQLSRLDLIHGVF